MFTAEETKQLELMTRDILPNYTDEKLEEYLEEWLDYKFKEVIYDGEVAETEEQYEHRKEIMLKLLINEKLKRVEAEYVEEVI